MTGWKPGVTFSLGFRIDSRRYASSTTCCSPDCEYDGLAEQVLQHRTASLRVGAMAGVAGEILEQLAAGGRQRTFLPAPVASHAW